jgi:hypothetical protein
LDRRVDGVKFKSVDWTALGTTVDYTSLPDSDARPIHDLLQGAVEREKKAVTGQFENLPRAKEVTVVITSLFILHPPVQGIKIYRRILDLDQKMPAHKLGPMGFTRRRSV